MTTATTTTSDPVMVAQHQAVDTAYKALNEGRAALLRPDGSRRYSDAEHSERDNALRGQFQRTIKDAKDKARARVVETEQRLARMDRLDPSSLLSADELATANARREFVKEDVEAAPWETVTQRLNDAMEDGDRVTVWLYRRYGARRAAKAAPGEAVVVNEALTKAADWLEPARGKLAQRLDDLQTQELRLGLHIGSVEGQIQALQMPGTTLRQRQRA